MNLLATLSFWVSPSFHSQLAEYWELAGDAELAYNSQFGFASNLQLAYNSQFGFASNLQLACNSLQHLLCGSTVFVTNSTLSWNI